MLDNILHTTGYVINVLNMFVEKPWVGLAIPPIVHISFYTFGHSWYNNRPMTEKIAGKMGLHVKFDDHTPVAPYGTMYWFRPPALRKMFEYEWSWGDYSAEPNHADGGMAHAQERVIAYVVQDAGFTTEHIASPRLAARNYALLEYKLSEICAKLPLAETGTLLHFLDQWRSAGLLSMTVRQSFREARLAVGRSLRFRLKRRFRKG